MTRREYELIKTRLKVYTAADYIRANDKMIATNPYLTFDMVLEIREEEARLIGEGSFPCYRFDADGLGEEIDSCVFLGKKNPFNAAQAMYAMYKDADLIRRIESSL